MRKILNFTTASNPMFAPFYSSSAITSSYSSHRLAVMGNLLFGILILKNIRWSSPQTRFNYAKMAFSSSTKTYKKFVVVGKPFANFFQHLSSECPNPNQKENFKPQLLVFVPSSALGTFWPCVRKFRAC
jgi:hypothetical protein